MSLRRCLLLAAGGVFVGAAAHAQQAPTCASPVTTCEGDSGYYASSEDRDRMQVQVDALLKDLRACLDAAGAKNVSPSIVARFDADGAPVAHKIDAPGYES